MSLARRLLAAAAMALMAGPGLAADPVPLPAELDALDLADKAPASADTPAAPPPWRAFVELAAGQDRVEPGGSVGWARASFDIRWTGTLAPGWRAVLSDRVDLSRGDGDARDVELNTLREAYVSWAVSPTASVDFGRVNIRHGVALGYNPTDGFKEGALRSITSADPEALRENRQGSVVLRGQQVWPQGSLALTLSPKLGSAPDDGAFDLNEGATNPRDRWLLAGSATLAEGFAPQLLLRGGDGEGTQLGVNLSALLGDATVLHAEWAGGDDLTLADRARGLGGPKQRLDRAALGFTYTTPWRLSLTVEAHHSGASPDRAAWQQLVQTDPAAAAALLALAQQRQELPARRAWFVHAAWKDVLVPRLDLGAFWRRETATDSDHRWLELRYRWPRADLALQWQQFSGDAGSIFGSVQPRRTVQLAWRHYFP